MQLRSNTHEEDLEEYRRLKLASETNQINIFDPKLEIKQLNEDLWSFKTLLVKADQQSKNNASTIKFQTKQIHLLSGMIVVGYAIFILRIL